MVLTQVEWNEGDQALLVWCILWWWLGWSTASHQPGLLVFLLSWACFPTELMAPDSWTWCLVPCSISILLLAITIHRKGWHCLGQSLWLLSGLICHLEPCLLWLEPATCERVVVSLLYLWWRSPIFPNNTESQADQVLVSLPETGMMNVMGCFQMPLDLQGHFSHLGGENVWPSIWILIPGFWSSRSPNLVPLIWKQWLWIETLDKFIQFGCKGPCKKIKRLQGFVSHIWSTVSWRSIHLPPTDSFTNVGTFPTW